MEPQTPEWSPDYLDRMDMDLSPHTPVAPPPSPEPPSPESTTPELLVTPRRRATPLQPITNVWLTPNSPALPSGYLSPASSPDEMVIQERGRRYLPLTWSPDIDFKHNPFASADRTPPKLNPVRLSPQNVEITLRSTPRKRLNLNERIPLHPKKIDFSDSSMLQELKITCPVKLTSPIKRSRVEKTSDVDFERPIAIALKGLSPTQLINIIKTITHKHPEIEKEIRMDMPKPDLGPLEERLNYLKSNIFKSLPTSRLTSKTDSPAYSRVATHLGAFKKCIIDQGKTLVESQHWESVVKYVFLAWSYVRATPVWDNEPHNAVRKQCFRALIFFCKSALNKGSFDRETLIDVRNQLQGISSDTEDVRYCLKVVQGQLQVFETGFMRNI